MRGARWRGEEKGEKTHAHTLMLTHINIIIDIHSITHTDVQRDSE